MGDPRNIAHAKKVTQEKHHKGGAAPSPQPGKKAPPSKKNQALAQESAAVATAQPAKSDQKPDPTKLEKALTVLTQLKELEFHSRANIEKLAELSLTIEEELKQKSFVGAIGDVYSAQEAFHSKIDALIKDYQIECDRLKPAAG